MTASDVLLKNLRNLSERVRPPLLGYKVTALDLPSSDYAGDRVFPVIDYDGCTLPLPDDSIDVIFSSNVLEHVQALDVLLRESRRVLAAGGIAIHILLTPSWRWWTALAHYPWLMLKVWRALGKIFAQCDPAKRGAGSKPQSRKRKPGSLLWPERHGERGSALTELYYFSSRWWRTAFSAAGFRVEASYPIGLFYTGSMLLCRTFIQGTTSHTFALAGILLSSLRHAAELVRYYSAIFLIAS